MDLFIGNHVVSPTEGVTKESPVLQERKDARLVTKESPGLQERKDTRLVTKESSSTPGVEGCKVSCKGVPQYTRAGRIQGKLPRSPQYSKRGRIQG